MGAVTETVTGAYRSMIERSTEAEEDYQTMLAEIPEGLSVIFGWLPVSGGGDGTVGVVETLPVVDIRGDDLAVVDGLYQLLGEIHPFQRPYDFGVDSDFDTDSEEEADGANPTNEDDNAEATGNSD
jgi:hypothetical protein